MASTSSACCSTRSAWAGMPAGQSVAGRARRDAAISSRTPGRCRATPRSVSTEAERRTWSRRSRSACDSATNSGAGPGSGTR